MVLRRVDHDARMRRRGGQGKKCPECDDPQPDAIPSLGASAHRVASLAPARASMRRVTAAKISIATSDTAPTIANAYQR